MLRQFVGLVVLFLLVSAGVFMLLPKNPVFEGAKSFSAVFFVKSSTEEILATSYQKAQNGQEKFTILVVPGHDSENWGADFRGLKENDMNLELSESLVGFFRSRNEINTVVLRDKNGYNPDFISYSNQHRAEIERVVEEQKRTMNALIQNGLIKPEQNLEHNVAIPEVAFTLYAINAWADSLGADLAIHVHFNDHPSRLKNSSGKYSGFAIYIPEQQYSNADGSRAVAEKVFDALASFYPSSDFPLESEGIVPDQELIAIGANNTLKSAAILLEYGYIYEPQFLARDIRSAVLRDLAFQTYRGVMDFLTPHWSLESVDRLGLSTTLLPYVWNKDLKIGDRSSKDVLIMQRALQAEGLYPPQGFSLSDCPPSGNYGPCTEKSVRAFQSRFGLVASGTAVGPQTRKALNNLFSK